MWKAAWTRFMLLVPVAMAHFVAAQATGRDGQRIIKFEDYPAPLKFHGRPVAPQHNSPLSRCFRTRIRLAAARGPNFADHYTVALWGCGGGCVAFVIVDAVDGRVYDFPYSVSWVNEIDSGVQGRRDSRVLHIVGSLNEEDNSADRWYLWTGKELKLIAERPARHFELKVEPDDK